MINHSISRKVLLVNGKQINFQEEIKNVIEVDGLLIVRIWNASTGDIQKQPLNNVYAIDDNGNIVWNLKDIIGDDGLYTMIRLNKENRLVAVEFIGMNYIIDVKNKQVIGGRAYK